MSTKHSFLLVTLLALSAAASAQTVTDGSFENTPELLSYEYNPLGTAWTYNRQSGLCFQSTPWHDAAEDGNQYAFIQSAPGSIGEITGTITGLTPGSGYALDFFLGTRAGYEINPLTVSVGGSVIANGVAPADDMSGTGWTEFRYGFSASSATTTVDFLGSDSNITLNPDMNTAIDNVTVQSVPEPGAFGVFGLGVLGLLVRRRAAKRG